MFRTIREVQNYRTVENRAMECWMFLLKYSYMYSSYIEDAVAENRMYRWYLANPVVIKKELSVTIQNEYVKPGSFYNTFKQQEASDDYKSIALWTSTAVLIRFF